MLPLAAAEEPCPGSFHMRALCSKRFVIIVLLLAGTCPWLALATVSASSQLPVSRINLPPDFPSRFMTVCQRRGLSSVRCACMSKIVLREVADEHLALMLDYLEQPAGFDSRALQELDNDESRMRVLEEEIQAAQAAARTECAAR